MERSLWGLAASAGLAFGPALVLRELETLSRPSGSSGEERAALEAAIGAAQADVARLAATLDGEAADILEFQLALLEDDALSEGAYAAIARGNPAQTAWTSRMEEEIAGYRASDNEYFRARAADLADIRDRVLRRLLDVPDAGDAPAGAILVARDLPPSTFLGTDWSKGGGIVLGEGSPSSHVAMLARGKGVPMVVGLGKGWQDLSGALLIDGDSGRIVVEPTDDVLAASRAAAAAASSARREAEARQYEPAVTRDGTGVAVMINVARLSDVAGLSADACDGIGLTRTEFLIENALQDEEAQFESYAGLVRWAAGRPVTIRTLDAGGDKPIAGYTVEGESNPFLGMRGIRLSLAHPAVFSVQLRALARAAALGPVKIMLPMVTVPTEIEHTRALLGAALSELQSRAVPCALPSLGMMVEVPAAALSIDAFNVDFASIGSNDLTQYATAASRDGAAVAGYADIRHPGVMALIAQVARHGARAGIDVSLCGDAGSDRRAVPALLRAGLRCLSVAPGLLGQTKQIIRAVDLSAAAESPP